MRPFRWCLTTGNGRLTRAQWKALFQPSIESSRRLWLATVGGRAMVTHGCKLGLCVALLVTSFLSGQNLTSRRETQKPEYPWSEREPASKIWPSEPPADCPFSKSKLITGIAFTGRHIRYANADTWYPSWAEDGNLYSSWTDGTVNNVSSDSAGPKATTGFATIRGDNPMDLQFVNAGVYPGNPSPYGGRYPCGSLVFKGVWYYGTY